MAPARDDPPGDPAAAGSVRLIAPPISRLRVVRNAALLHPEPTYAHPVDGHSSGLKLAEPRSPSCSCPPRLALVPRKGHGPRRPVVRVGVVGPRHIHISASQKVLPVVTADELASPAVRVQFGAAGLVEEVRYGAGRGVVHDRYQRGPGRNRHAEPATGACARDPQLQTIRVSRVQSGDG